MVLCIKNRTENWKTAYYFAPLFRDTNARLELAQRLGEPKETNSDEVTIELFWKGLRDFRHQTKEGNGKTLSRDMMVKRYAECFSSLRGEIEEYCNAKTQTLGGLNERTYYVPKDEDTKAKCKLESNLINTEIDIVLESPRYIFIGEAKSESGFGSGNSNDVLRHQLIRQYVMASILLQHCCPEKEVIPFVVGPQLKDRSQVEFMICHGWMKKCNVLEWKEIKNLACIR